MKGQVGVEYMILLLLGILVALIAAGTLMLLGWNDVNNVLLLYEAQVKAIEVIVG